MAPAAPATTVRPQGELTVLAWPALDAFPVDVFVTTRAGGVSSGPYESLNLGLHVGDDPAAVIENRRRVAAAVGVGLDDLVFCRQTHGRVVVTAHGADRGRGARDEDTAIPGADALVTVEVDLPIVVLMADCVPVVLYDPVAHVVACVHAGWRGTVARVIDAAIGSMVARGAAPARIIAGVGPAIAGAAYQVGPEVQAAALDCFGGDGRGIVEPDLTDPDGDRWRFDLWAANARILREAGVPAAQIHVTDQATGATSPFFSDRAQRPCGRFGLVACLRAR